MIKTSQLIEALQRATKKIPHGNDAPNAGSSLGNEMNTRTASKYKETDQQPTKVTESEDIHAAILRRFSDKDGLSVGKASIHTFKNQNGIRKYHVYPVTYSGKGIGGSPRQYATYVHHEEGSTVLKSGLPTKRGGDIKSVD